MRVCSATAADPIDETLLRQQNGGRPFLYFLPRPLQSLRKEIMWCTFQFQSIDHSYNLEPLANPKCGSVTFMDRKLVLGRLGPLVVS